MNNNRVTLRAIFRHRVVAMVSCLCIIFFLIQTLYGAAKDSVTIDEFALVPLGSYILTTGDLTLDPINPPLGKALLALPQLLTGTEIPTDPSQGGWGLGYQFMGRNSAQYHRAYFYSRCMVIGIGVLLMLLCGWWSAELYGSEAGAAALFLLATSPTLLAHAHLATLDVLGSFAFMLAIIALWRLLQKQTVTRSLVCGIAIALALLTKLSSVILIISTVLIILLHNWKAIRTERVRISTALALVLVMVAVLNLGYGFTKTFIPLSQGNFFQDGLFASISHLVPTLRIPLPISFLEGLDRAIEEGKHIQGQSYLFGELSTQGWWYYHLVAFAAKTPIPFLLLSVFAIARAIKVRAVGGKEILIPLALLFAANVFGNSQQIGVRHVISAYPLLAILAAPYLVSAIRSLLDLRFSTASTAAVAILFGCTSSATMVGSRHLQYFNAAFGGEARGHEVLIDSNLDWGQDLLRLKEFMDEQKIRRVHLAYFGRVDPRVYGISFVPLVEGSKGIAVVSASFLMGRTYVWFKSGELAWLEPRYFDWIKSYQPIGRVGSMFIFELK